MVTINVYIDEEDLQEIDQGAKKEKRSRSQFMVIAALERARYQKSE